MGTDKAAIEVRKGTRQLDYAIDLLRPFCVAVAVAVGKKGSEARSLSSDVRAVFDPEGVSGPMAGVIAGLRAAEGNAVMAIACDMPYLEPSVLVKLVNRRDSERVASAFVAPDGKLDPMCAIYEARGLGLLEKCVAEGKISLRRFLEENDVERIALDRPIFLASVNDQSDLAKARERLS